MRWTAGWLCPQGTNPKVLELAFANCATSSDAAKANEWASQTLHGSETRVQVVWFKRDIRLADHAPLVKAARQGPCLCLYVYEPELLDSDEFDPSHLEFINQSLAELNLELRPLGGRLTYRLGRMPDVLEQLHAQHSIDALWSHQETGNDLTYQRDRRVAAWARRHRIPWREIPQNGVIRRLQTRNGWSRQRDQILSRPCASKPVAITSPVGIDSGQLVRPDSLGWEPTRKEGLPIGGERAGNATLQSFLYERGETYNRDLSSPLTAAKACSRLSPYLAWGCLSIKQVRQALQHRQRELEEESGRTPSVRQWQASLEAFQSRLSWHCHFMQKLEDGPQIEFRNMNRAYDGLREEEFNQDLFEAWCNGQTGYPLVDACMRALHRHSWINFRMRAMLISFASYHLWLHWRPTAVFLAKHFLDFEPGIHFSQVQMQAGTTGINALRIYSPSKQAREQDPDGEFIRHFVPELANMPDEFIAEPHRAPLSTQDRIGCRVGRDYPRPIVDHAKAYRAAQARMKAIRVNVDSQREAKRVLEKHGSRARPTRRRRSPSSDRRLF